MKNYDYDYDNDYYDDNIYDENNNTTGSLKLNKGKAIKNGAKALGVFGIASLILKGIADIIDND